MQSSLTAAVSIAAVSIAAIAAAAGATEATGAGGSAEWLEFSSFLALASRSSGSIEAKGALPAVAAQELSLFADSECEGGGSGGHESHVDDSDPVWASASGCALSALQLRKGKARYQPPSPSSAWKLDPSLADRAWPSLCDPDLVSQGCKVLTPDGTGVATTTFDLADGLGATDTSTSEFLNFIGIPSRAGANVEIDCMALCFHVMDSVGPEFLPPRSDVACRPDYAGTAICDIDLSNGSVEAIMFEGTPVNFHEGHSIYVTPKPKGTDEKEDLEELDDTMLNHIDILDAENLVASLFRVYPLVDISLGFGDEEDGDLDAPLRAQAHVADAQAATSEDTIPTNIMDTNTSEELKMSPVFRYRPELRAQQGGHMQPWVSQVQRISVKAQAYVSFALRRAPVEHDKLVAWFGIDNARVRRRVMAVLRSISRMLGNVEYRRGRHCDPDTYAYVYPGDRSGPERGTKNLNGQYLLYLCDLYFNSTEAEQIEVLTHEGSHHATAFTDDICLGWIDSDGACHGTEVYGRRLCKKVAVQHPRSARNNADSFCYYINDLNGSE
mmetsp:Transcript_50532/g.109019  ORF Transcript_50532/g.109019 Transcript_50532/m.109019 type:complete len:555 (-) Transcript_50532:213-1877(-)|eukprot:CAMPEP_0206531192 /NCGR_PEP_ID=MMETSP0325_2-20121206/3622_1 /ASSEMBLY_ACC=CAM_ASM_000347 /TAXON_ID=2866 /ORGANISM="Crypthecodinium cohnii, Strain Seligo" /LENGTH=554 /DNA_ID=CAMNT_0054027395 /DNA_START=71 /DNA_END=1735 /DNA_ORIENTATION=-